MRASRALCLYLTSAAVLAQPSHALVPNAFLLPIRRCFGLPPPLRGATTTRTAMASAASSDPAGTDLKDMLGSGVSCPQLGIGLAALGRPGYISLTHKSDFDGVGKGVEAMRERAYEVLDASWDKGVRYFDAARSYGRAEEFLGGWLEARKVAPGDVCVGSKWGYTYTADWQTDTGGEPHEVKEHSRENLVKQSKETQEMLGKYMNLYQIHSATQASGVLQNASVIEELWQIKKQRGWKIGLSLSGVEQADTLRLAMGVKSSEGELLFDSVQATYNVLESSCGEALQEAFGVGMQVIVKEGMANGRVFEEGNKGPSREKLSFLHAEAARIGCSVDALSLACIMVQGFRPMVLSGAATKAHLESNSEALALVSRSLVTRDVALKILEATRMPPDAYWGERGGLAWQ
mmetsp:Transcript_12238/g.24149  ORF Transcript_12238/g.24149 Transcript_12238/m.24149 type:complete len:405 (-) Transcript_12238:31-1245(-)